MEAIIFKGEILGYRVSGNCYKTRFIRNLNIDTDSAIPLQCIRVGGKYLAKDGQIIVWCSLRNSTDYSKLLKSLYKDGIRFSSDTIFFKKITRKALISVTESYKMSSYWGRTYTDCYEILSSTGDTLGLIKFRVSSSEVQLKMIDIIEKDKGWGTIVVNKLLSDYKLPIEGYSCIEARKFWKKMGAKFVSDYIFTVEVK